MTYYKLLMVDTTDQDAVANLVDCFGFDHYHLSRAEFVDSPPDIFVFHFDPVNGNLLTDYLANDMGWLLVSKRLKDIIMELIGPHDVQIIPANVIAYSNGLSGETYDYYVLNVLTIVDGVELSKSDYHMTDLGDRVVYTIRKPVIRETAVDGLNMFKLEKTYISIFVSEIFRNKVLEANISGVGFLDVGTV